MATIRHRGGKWQVQVRRQKKTLSKSFNLRADAQRWANRMEAEADCVDVFDQTLVLQQHTLEDILVRFRDEVSPKRRGGPQEITIINAFLRHRLARIKLSEICPSDFAVFRDERLRQVKAGTVLRQLGLLRAIINHARTEWNLPIDNPIQAIRKPRAERGRERRVSVGEWTRLMQACQQARTPYIQPLVRLAVETGMRRGELLNMQWAHINWNDQTLQIPRTKTDTPRTIPLTPLAVEILGQLQRHDPDYVFPVTANGAQKAWQRLTKRAGISDLHFHDLRHEAISRFFEMGLSIPEVALISGHKDPRMLFRYTQLRAEDVARKIQMLPNSATERCL